MTSVSTDRRQGVNSGRAWKVPVKVATTANIVLSGLQTIDGVVLAQDDRVLVKNQNNTVNNGVYVADSGEWARAVDFDGAYDIAHGTMVLVTNGTLNAQTIWQLSTADPIVIDTSNISFFNMGTLQVISRQRIVAAAGQKIFPLAHSYSPGINAIQVFVDGLLVEGGGVDYTETDANTITFTYALGAGQQVTVLQRLALAGSVSTDASNIPVTIATGEVTNVGAMLQKFDVCETVAAMKNKGVPLVTTAVLCLGFAAAGDGGGGVFYWNAADVRADDGGTIIQLNAGGNGRFNKIL